MSLLDRLRQVVLGEDPTKETAPQSTAEPEAVDPQEDPAAAEEIVEEVLEEAPAPAPALSAEDILAAEQHDAMVAAPPMPRMSPVLPAGIPVLALISGKGGVGRTTTTLGLAGAAARKGKRVLIVDLDPQGSLTLAALDSVEVPSSERIFTGAALSSLGQKIEWDNVRGEVHLVPARRTLARWDHIAQDPREDVFGVGIMNFDAVIMETPASLEGIARFAAAIASHIVVVAEPSIYSVKAATEAADFVAGVPAAATQKRNVFALLNKLVNTEEAEFRAAELREKFAGTVLESAISHSSVIVDANGSGVPVSLMPGVEAQTSAKEYDAVWAELMKAKF